MTQRAIEVSFPIVEVNRLAVPERNAFKPIYQMHKWFARRSSSVFRAILLGCLKPAGTDIMAEFYKDHFNDPDTNGKVILDPFMGGGTTVVEALRLGCNVVGIDLNPVAWFIVKTETEPVDIDELQAAFERLENRTVSWSGKSVKETLQEQYKTDCGCCGQEADIMFTFWVKSAICHNALCPGRSGDQGLQVPLFSDYIVAQKTPTIRYWREVTCPKCKKNFDWEVEPTVLVPEVNLQENASRSGGIGRTSSRWAYSASKTVDCPWCHENVAPAPPKSLKPGQPPKKERKKVPLTVLLCPACESVWQYRGELPEKVSCPVCNHAYAPMIGNIPDKGKFICPTCGTKDSIVNSLRQIPNNELLPMRPYALEAHCSLCEASKNSEELEMQSSFLQSTTIDRKETSTAHLCALSKMGGKYFKRISPMDLSKLNSAQQIWEKENDNLPYPKQKIPVGFNTNQMRNHNYLYWYQMFNSRQLLGLSTLLGAINQEPNQSIKETFLSTFQTLLDRNNMFCRYFNDRDTVQGLFSRHDFQPKLTPTELSIWGDESWRGTFPNLHNRTLDGKSYGFQPYDNVVDKNGVSKHVASSESVYSQKVSLFCDDSTTSTKLTSGKFDFAVTDPPYAGNVNYSELADFFYVWLKLVLQDVYKEFAPDETSKILEVGENPVTGKTSDDFKLGLTSVFHSIFGVLKENGILTFTFHHAEGSAWESVLDAVCLAGFEILAAYPIHGEKESSLSLQDSQSISYDLIHVCKKRDSTSSIEKRSWAGIRQEIRRKAREEIRDIETGRYGNEPLSGADINIVLIGKCLELYSRHYGAVIDHEGNQVSLHEALIEIRSMVDQLVEKQRPLPSELDDIDAASRMYLLNPSDKKEVKSDDLHKATRGVLEPDDMAHAGLIIKGRAKGGRAYEVKQPAERLSMLMDMFQPDNHSLDKQLTFLPDVNLPKPATRALFIDKVHLLLALADSGENLMPWLEKFAGDRPRLRAAFVFLGEKNKNFTSACEKLMRLIDPLPLFGDSASDS